MTILSNNRISIHYKNNEMNYFIIHDLVFFYTFILDFLTYFKIIFILINNKIILFYWIILFWKYFENYNFNNKIQNKIILYYYNINNFYYIKF